MKKLSITPATKPLTKKHTSTIWANIDPETRAVLHDLGAVHPDSLTTAQAAGYLSGVKGIQTAKSTLEVFRCQNRGPAYRKIGSRVFYSVTQLDKYAAGVEIKIFDPCAN